MPRVFKIDSIDETFKGKKDLSYYNNSRRLYPASVRVKMAEMSPRARHNMLARRAAYVLLPLCLAYTSQPNGMALLGKPSTQISKQERITAGRSEAARSFDQATVADRFSIQFIAPATVETQASRGGESLIGAITTSSEITSVQYGQDCLAGTAYDTTSASIRGGAHGDISAVAALRYRADSKRVTIYPAGSNAGPLEFNVNPSDQTLVPEAATIDTLIAYGCQTTGLVELTYEGDYPQGVTMTKLQ